VKSLAVALLARAAAHFMAHCELCGMGLQLQGKERNGKRIIDGTVDAVLKVG
jgi:hypothetical protein